MISAANTGQPAPSEVTDRKLDLAVARDIPISNSCALPPAVQPPDVSPSLSQDESIPTWKRLLDLSLIFLTTPVWLSTMGFVSLWILMVSPGPLLYRQERIGYRGRRFMILKFRTMHVNSETLSHEDYFEKLMQSNCPMTKLDIRGDSRLIRGGRILRALGLDELPQLFNVMRSEMSLVGPRPCTPHEFDHYRPEQKLRITAPPGLTGYWQVNGKNKTSFSQMISMDIYYGQHMSVLMDMGIILKTLPAIGIQVCESVSRKTSYKLKRLWQAYGAADTAPPDMACGELKKDTRTNT
jgi:lipopolysaccharide/colanic/teichoic acid biosynthesis glycosyltransferase